MRVRVTPPDVIGPGTTPLQEVTSLDSLVEEIQEDVRPESIDYSNGLLLTSLSYIIWGVVFIANSYAIVMLLVRAK